MNVPLYLYTTECAITCSMCKSVQTLLNQYGSSKIKEIKFRDAFALVGERGLPGNLGKEKVRAVDPRPD